MFNYNVEFKKILNKINSFKIKNNNIRDSIINNIYTHAEKISNSCIKKDKKINIDKKIDDIVTSKIFGIPIMLVMLLVTLWITIKGANYPSKMLADFLFYIGNVLNKFFNYLNVPHWLNGILISGLYKTIAWVVSVMLPPMAIFFPIFTLLEDLGYLPRVCFNLDHAFKKACAHGKQALTMCMGFGCNAAGVISTRIIDSPREKLIAIITNNFVPCNGRFPTLIAISTIFFGLNISGKNNYFISSFVVALIVIFGIIVTLLVSYVLSKTMLKGIPSSFTLELPSYRKPQILRVLYTSIIDRTIFVLKRAILIAAPAGIITYILGNVYIGNINIISHIANFLDPFAHAIGLDGFILMAFLLGLPANEIVLPILIMAYLSKGTMIELESLQSLKTIFIDNGWTTLTAINTMLFSLLHFPCGTTIWTIKKETGSIKWTLVSIFLPTFLAIIVCFLTTKIFHMF